MPGSGHIYLRKDLKGIGFCLATATGYSLTGVYIYRSFLGSASSGSLATRLMMPGLFFLISIILHVVGIVEAYADAEEINRDVNYGNADFDNPYVAKLTVEE